MEKFKIEWHKDKYRARGYKKAFYHGIKIWFNEETGDVLSRGIVSRLLIDIVIWFNINILLEQGFPIYIEDDPHNQL